MPWLFQLKEVFNTWHWRAQLSWNQWVATNLHLLLSSFTCARRFPSQLFSLESCWNFLRNIPLLWDGLKLIWSLSSQSTSRITDLLLSSLALALELPPLSLEYNLIFLTISIWRSRAETEMGNASFYTWFILNSWSRILRLHFYKLVDYSCLFWRKGIINHVLHGVQSDFGFLYQKFARLRFQKSVCLCSNQLYLEYFQSGCQYR